jgi:hypothetical protein
MAKLTILGTQRVKALQEILATKEAEAISNAAIPTYAEIARMVDAEYGIDKWRGRLDALVGEAKLVADKINTATGKQLTIETHERSYSTTQYTARIKELTRQLRDSVTSEIRKEFKAKSNLLWLCETMEEAKEIVGI